MLRFTVMIFHLCHSMHPLSVIFLHQIKHLMPDDDVFLLGLQPQTSKTSSNLNMGVSDVIAPSRPE